MSVEGGRGLENLGGTFISTVADGSWTWQQIIVIFL